MKIIAKGFLIFLLLFGLQQVVHAQSGYKIKNSNGANIRQGPGKEKAVITTIPAGAKVKVVEKSGNDWYKVEYNGKTGYVSSTLIEEDKENETPQNHPGDNQ